MTAYTQEQVAMQPSLFDAGEVAVDEAFPAARRIWLDEAAWIEHVPGWLSGNGELLASPRATVPGVGRERWMFTRMIAEPRLTAEYPVLADAPQPPLRAIAAALSAHYGVPYDGLG